ncbi:cupin domain-containing protein [Catenuloplanes japonicus]|uniref:cupin domain-containing protein n=1 Tax=Catenuloplanes japonicus TaxID=33876 RepID=UPI000AD46BF7|nr:cupin domain-containing protein [Catenuloplanes japonicus]
MRTQRHERRTAVIAAAAAALTLGTAGVAQATPPTGEVSGTILAEWDAFGKHYVHRLVYLGADSATGWHYHDGTLYARVVQGRLHHFDSDCEEDVPGPRDYYGAGQFILEPSGPGHVHIGMNKGQEQVILDVLYALPIGAPLSQDAPAPGCTLP